MKDKIVSIILVLSFTTLAFSAFLSLNIKGDFPVEIVYNYPVKTPEQQLDIGENIKDTDSAGHLKTKGTFPIELNTATSDELMAIPGVGKTISLRIVEHRDFLGGYSTLEQLMEIRGIGERTYCEISPYLYLEDENFSSK